MADEKKPPTSSGETDLKARLRLSSKSLKQKAEEEEARKRAEEEARRKAEAEKARQEQARQDQFSLAGSGGEGRTEWSSHWEVPDEEELKKLEAMPDSGKGGKRIVLAVIMVLVVAFALGVGYYFGRAFFARSLQNARIIEAQEMQAYHDKGRAQYFEAIDEHKKKIKELVETFQKPDLTPQFQLRQLYAFLDHCDDFLEKNKPLSARELFGGEIYNSDLATDVISYVDALNRLFMMTDQMLRERSILMLVGSGEEEEEEPEPLMAYMHYEYSPQGEEVKIPWNEGSVIAIPNESWKQIKPAPVEEGEEKKEVEEGAEREFVMPVKKGREAEVVEVNTKHIVQFDAWPLIKRQQGIYRMALLERAKITLGDLNAVAEKVNWGRVKAKLDELAQKELYFTL